jgi:hypothetical protein
MSTQPNDGGPAFPLPSHTKRWDPNNQIFTQDEGMTLRDYFAAAALQGLLASGHFTTEADNTDQAWLTTHECFYDESEERRQTRAFDFPEAAWRCADAMIEARERKEEA